VPIKRVVDYNVRVQVKPDGSGVATDGVKMSINPFDEIAIEEALRLKEQGKADEVLQSNAEVQPLQAASALLKVAEEEQPGLVIMGKQAIDDDNNQTPQMLATLWHRPQATFVSQLSVEGDKATLNEPRFVKLPDIMKAKRKPLDARPLADVVEDFSDSQLEISGYEAPQPRQKGVMVENVDELIALLKEKGLVA